MAHSTRHKVPLSIGRWMIGIIIHFASVAADSSFHFEEQPVNQSVLIGSDLTLRCAIAQLEAQGHHNAAFHMQYRSNKGIILNHQHHQTEIPGYAGRYSYTRDSPEQLHLNIRNVSLQDDGYFQCQALKPGGKFLRANAFINVLVPPSVVHFEHYRSGSTVVVNEGIPMNITCVAVASKPEVELNLFLNGKLAAENVHRGRQVWPNGTVDTYASLTLRPGRSHHNKVVSCEANHPETGTKLRDSINLDVYYSSDRPKIDLIGAAGDRPLKAGQNITLLCTAEGGNPPPQLIWSNQNGAVGENYSYDVGTQITRNAHSIVLQGADNGAIYECASQTHQNVTPLVSRVTLRVDYPPASVFIFGNTVVRKGETLAMSCASGLSSPASVITWQINGSPTKMQPQTQNKQVQGFVTESNITAIDSSTLLHGQHQIAVECTASNGEGSPVAKSHVVRVLSAPSHPVIFESEPNTVPLEGTLYNLTCEAQGGHPFATLSWFRGVEKLKESQNSLHGDSARSTVTLLLDRSMNHQQVRCEAENGATDLPLVARKNLVVLFPPSQVKIQPTRNVHMVAGTPTELSCSVPSSNPVADLSWEFPNSANKQLTVTRTGEQVRRSSKPIGEYYGFESANVIQFTPTESMDKSEVRCVASHHLWEEGKYGIYELDVKYPPRIAVEGQMSIVVGEGQSFEENITIHANPRVNAYAWRKNGITIDRSVGSIFVRQNIIGGVSMEKEDAGIYTLFVSNGVGTANATIKIVVEYSARITYITTPVIASVGEDVVLECEADGMPLRPGMIKWSRGQSEMKSLVQDQRRAVIRMNASHENSGAYTCSVDNGIGQPNFTNAYLLVRRAPTIFKNPALGRAAGPIGGKATLRCRASAVPNAEFTWGIEGEGHMIHHNTTKYRFFDTQLDHTTFQSTLTVLNLEDRDYARRYRCRVSNRLGYAQTFISVGPPTPPETPTELEIVNVTNWTASISWTPGFDGGAEQLFELLYQDMEDNQIRSVNTSEAQVLLKDLELKHSYRLQIRSINARGEISDLTQPLIFRTLDENQNEAFSIVAKDRPFSEFTILAFCAGLIGLLTLNCVLICYLHRRNKRRKMREKRALNQNGQCGRSIQIYGAMTAVQQPQQQRPGSTPTTNRSELNHQLGGGGSGGSGEQISAMEDSQSTRTIIEVSPYGQFNGIPNNNDFFYNSACIAEFDSTDPATDYYAKIQKGSQHFQHNNYPPMQQPAFDTNLSYQAIPNPEPPYQHLSTPNLIQQQQQQYAMDNNHYPPPSPYVETRSACFVQTTPVHGNLIIAPRMLSTFQHENGGISIRDTYEGDLV